MTIKHKTSRRIFILIGCVMLWGGVGCVSPNESLLAAAEDASLFKRALFTQYTELARRELAEGNREAAKVYQAKAMKSIAADEPDLRFGSWSMKSEDGKLLQESFNRLNGVIVSDQMTKAPKESARAVAMYDCWLEEMSEGVDPGDIAACRTSFFSALKYLEASPATDQQVSN